MEVEQLLADTCKAMSDAQIRIFSSQAAILQTMEKMVEIQSRQQGLIDTNAALIKQIASMITWVTGEATGYRKTQSDLLWKVTVAVLGFMDAALLAIIGIGAV
jgi:hypothetical protein